MKVIKYQISTDINFGTEDNPEIQQILQNKVIEYSAGNEAIAKKEAYNGEVFIEDDGVPEPEPTQAEQLRADVDYLSAMTGVMLL